MKSLIQIIILGIVALFIASFVSIPDTFIQKTAQNIEVADIVVSTEEAHIDELEVVVVEEEIVDKMPVVKEAEVITEILDTAPTGVEEIIVEESVVFQVEDKTEKVSQIPFSQINEDTRKALVNIFCTTKSGGSFRPITGSGVVIDDRGIIITNAHVAQYFLLKDYLVKNFIDCVIRAGSPAVPQYKAEPIFISPSWVETNANGIIQQTPKGTGEDDYALLLVTERIDSSKPLPDKFSFVEPLYNSGNIEIGDNILLAAYPAGFLSGISISRDLYISSAVTQVMEVFTFKEGTLDLFSIGGSVVAQQGSSGGAVVDTDNKLLGIIVTSSTADQTGDRDLRAITIAHINRSFVKDTGFDFQTLLSGNIKAEADAFNKNIAPELTKLLVDELEK